MIQIQSAAFKLAFRAGKKCKHITSHHLAQVALFDALFVVGQFDCISRAELVALL